MLLVGLANEILTSVISQHQRTKCEKTYKPVHQNVTVGVINKSQCECSAS